MSALAHSYVLPDAALAEVVLPTAEDLARSPALHFQRGTELYRAGPARRGHCGLPAVCGAAAGLSPGPLPPGGGLGDAEQYDEAMA